MKKPIFLFKKWASRAFVAMCSTLGLTACVSHPESVYGPPPPDTPDIEVIEDVYGPPPPEYTDSATDDQQAPAIVAEPAPVDDNTPR